MQEQDHHIVWQNCLGHIKNKVSEQQFQTWFLPILPKSLEGNNLTVQVPSKFFYEWIEKHYVDLLTVVLKKVLGNQGKLSYAVLVQNNDQDKEQKKPLLSTKDQTPSFSLQNIAEKYKQANLNSQYTFSNLIEADCNQLAVSAAKTVAKNPGKTAFNPLVIYGAVGLGKTHIAQAIGNEVTHHFSHKFVLYVSSERFTNQFITAIKNNDIQNFLNFYLQIDVLIIDDIQFFNAKEKTQEIFFHIFNHLHQNQRQIVMTSDCAPRNLPGLQHRLLSRFKWGLTADLQNPDFETRIAIINVKIKQEKIQIPEAVIEYIAASVHSSIRELEGVVTSIIAHAAFKKNSINLDLTKKVLLTLVAQIEDQDIKIDFIQKLTAEHFHITFEELKAKSRKKNMVIARQVAMYLCKEFTSYSLKQIGNFFGGRDHSTVIYAIQNIEKILKDNKDEKFLDHFYKLKHKFQPKTVI